jgi:hypothetical protein
VAVGCEKLKNVTAFSLFELTNSRQVSKNSYSIH